MSRRVAFGALLVLAVLVGAYLTAARFMKEGGAHCVKLEGGVEMVPQIERLTRGGIPVMAHIGFTAPYNMSGQPAGTVNCGFTGDGRPIGLQVAGRRFDDVGVLRLLHWVENSRPAEASPDWPILASAEGERDHVGRQAVGGTRG